MKKLCALFVLLSLSGCSTPPVTDTCGTSVRPVPSPTQAQMAFDLEDLPDTSPVRTIMVPDWERMRADIRACEQASK